MKAKGRRQSKNIEVRKGGDGARGYTLRGNSKAKREAGLSPSRETKIKNREAFAAEDKNRGERNSKDQKEAFSGRGKSSAPPPKRKVKPPRSPIPPGNPKKFREKVAAQLKSIKVVNSPKPKKKPGK